MFGILKSALVEIYDLVDPHVSEALEDTTDHQVFERILKENGIILEADVSHLNRTVRLDRNQAGADRHTNLLTNAFKYREKRVILSCSTEGPTVRLSVKDDGPGIPECYHDQIFDQYFQCLKVEGFPVRGHGLGLAGALALTEAMGGTLTLCSTPTGAEFKIEVKCSL